MGKRSSGAALARMTPQRRLLVDVLARLGPVAEASGRATTLLYDLMVENGYEGGPSGFKHVLGNAEFDGLIERDINGRRCYAIRATPKAIEWWQTHAVADVTEEIPQLEEEPPEVTVPGHSIEDVPDIGTVEEPAFDYDELARRLLREATRAIGRAEGESALLARIAELEAAVKDAETKARDRVRIELESLVEERKGWEQLAIQQEEAAAVFKDRCLELSEEVDRLKGVVRKYREAEQQQRNGYKVRELLDPEGRQALDRLMREVPVRRGP